jgi:hypothetical protein
MQTGIRTLTAGLYDRRLGTMFLGALVAIPVAGIAGLPLLLLLLLLFALNPFGLGQALARCRWVQSVPGFRCGHRGQMAWATLLYLLPLSLLGMAVIGIDGMILGIFP